MDKNTKTDPEIEESIRVYPSIKPISDPHENQKYLSFFFINENEEASSNKRNKKEISREKEQKPTNTKDEHNLINKCLEQQKTKTKRTIEVKRALGSFLRKSDLIEKISKLLEDKENEKDKPTDIYLNSVVAKLAANVIMEKYKKDEFILKMNEIGENCYFLLSGSLTVLKPILYHKYMTYDEYIQYLANLLKYQEYDIINNIRLANKNYIDIGVIEELREFIKSYFIIKFKNDIIQSMKNDKLEKDYIQNRFKSFNLSFEDYDLNSFYIIRHIEEIMKGSNLKKKDLMDYLNLIFPPEKINKEILYSNPYLFDNDKYKFTIYKYEEFLYLKPGSFFGETALDNSIRKRNASIRAEEDSIILSLDNNIYHNLLYDYNRKFKTIDVVFLCRNFFFNNISTKIFIKNYFPFFKLLRKRKDDIIYKQSTKMKAVYFIKEGDIKLEINASIIDIYNIIKYYYDKLIHNTNIKIAQEEIDEIKKNYLEDKTITDIIHQSNILKEKLNTKVKFELFTSSYCDTLGLEEYFLKNKYLCTSTVISKEAKIFEINSDSLNTIMSNEKNCSSSYYNFIGNKLVNSIKRLHIIKNNLINQFKYKIKENFYGTEVPETNLIKGQSGIKKPFCKYLKNRHEPRSLNSFYRNSENEEIKNQNFRSLQKAALKLNLTKKNYSTYTELNITKVKSMENSSYEDLKNKTNKILKIDSMKNSFVNNFNKKNQRNNSIIEKKKIIEKEIKSRKNMAKRIMETTIIKIGKDSLTLKDIDNRLKSNEKPKNLNLSIVKNFYKTTTTDYSQPKSMNNKDKNCNNNNIFSLKKDIKSIDNKLPGLYNMRYNKHNIFYKKIYNKTNKERFKNTKIILKPLIITSKMNLNSNYFKILAEKRKSSCNATLTDQNALIIK